ncbi:MAG: winged helix-turn-helix domain-containing protein, partial [Myxococcales bacterium]|nr:winged helix-turn-helix domain-containing protein [Myxococcales bacterium]
MRIRTEHLGLRELADRAGLTVADTGRVDAVLLGGSGAWDHARALRAGGHTVPLVVLTDGAPALDRARLEPVVLLRELDAGALREALRMCAVGRPAGRVRLASGTADLDLGRFERVDGTREPLSSLECRFVGYLAARTGRAASRDELQLQVWDHRRPVATRAVDMLVARLRRKIEEDPRHPTALLTASGGYRLLVDTGSPQISDS